MNSINAINRYHKKLKEISQLISLTEDLDEFRGKYSEKFSVFKTFLLDNKEEISELIAKINLKISIEVECQTIYFKDIFKRSIHDDNDVNLSLFINKKVNLYNSSDHYVFFERSSLIQIIDQSIITLFKNKIIKKNIYTHIDGSFSIDNGYIKFINIDTIKADDIEPSLKEELSDENLKTLTDFESIINKNTEKDISELLCPIVLFFENLKDNDLSNSLSKQFICYFAKSTCSQVLDNYYSFKAMQNVSINKSFDSNPENLEEIYYLYNFIFDKDKYIDKKEIFLNVLTLYMNDSSNLSDLDKLSTKIRETVDSHFSSYIQNGIKQFFDQRKDIQKEAFNAAIDAKHQADKIIQNINLLMLGLLTASLSTIFTFFRGEVFIFLIAVLGHLLYFFLSATINIANFRHKKADIEDAFDSYVDHFSSLIPEEVNKIKKTHLVPALNRLRNSFIAYKIISLLLIILMSVVAYGIIIYYDLTIKEIIDSFIGETIDENIKN